MDCLTKYLVAENINFFLVFVLNIFFVLFNFRFIFSPSSTQTIGNVAWAHIRAKDTLKNEPKKIAGLPVFITDDTPIEDTTRFCQRISRATNTLKLRPTWWSLPTFFTYFIAFLLEFFVQIANRLFTGVKLSFQPRTLVAYASSIIMFSRLRASIHLDYEPIFKEDKSILNSAGWYEKWYNDYALTKGIKKVS